MLLFCVKHPWPHFYFSLVELPRQLFSSLAAATAVLTDFVTYTHHAPSKLLPAPREVKSAEFQLQTQPCGLSDEPTLDPYN